MTRATGSWTVMVKGIPHQVQAEWDVFGTGGGAITVDGTVIKSWWLGLKWPGATKRFRVGGKRFKVVKRGISDLQLDLFDDEVV